MLPPLVPREVCLPGHSLTPIPGRTGNKMGYVMVAVGAAVGTFEPGAGGEGKGWAADKECFLKQKRKCWLGRRGKEAASCCWW